jgi:MFS family permease
MLQKNPSAGSSHWPSAGSWSDWLHESVGRNPAGQAVTRGYLIYLLIFATGGWGMAAYDFNLQVMTMPLMAKSLGLSPTQVGLLGFFVDFSLFFFSVVFGFYMDQQSRINAWIAALAGTTVFTGLTFFAHNFWELSIIRALASGLAYTELSISITLVNESLPAKRRGFYYSIVQSGWPQGVLFAAIIYQISVQIGWHKMFLLGVAPFMIVVLGRFWIKEPEIFRRQKEIRRWCECDQQDRAKELSEKYHIPIDQAVSHSVKELFQGEQRRQTWVVLISFFFYGATSVATNLYIVYWMTHYIGYSGRGAVYLMLVSAAIGIAPYILWGWLGERISRRKLLFYDALLIPAFAIGFMFMKPLIWAGVMYFFLYQVINGFWSGAAFTYAAESYPTKLRGRGVAFSDAAMVAGYVLGAAIWTGLVSHIGHLAVWAIIAVGLAFGTWVIGLGKDYDPTESLK